MKFTAFLFIYLVIVLCFFCNVQAANDSTKTYYDTTALNYKRCVTGITRDTGTGAVTLCVPQSYLARLPYDTTNGILFNPLGANNLWPKSKMKSDSMGVYSIWDLLDTIFIHGGKYLKKVAK